MNRPLEPDNVDLTGLVLPERRNAEVGVEQERLHAAGRHWEELQDLARTKVSIDVRPERERAARATVNVTPRNGTAPSDMVVVGNGVDETRRGA